MKSSELAALSKLRSIRLDKAQADLAGVRQRMREADRRLSEAERDATNARQVALGAAAELANSKPRDLMSLLDGRDHVAQANRNADDARERVEERHADRIELLDEQAATRKRWRDRKREVERWDNLMDAERDAQEQKALKREDAEEANRLQVVLKS